MICPNCKKHFINTRKNIKYKIEDMIRMKDKGMSLRAIARLHGCTAPTVAKKLRDYQTLKNLGVLK